MRELKYIELGLENCQVIKIDKKFIGEFLINDIKETVTRTACNSISNYNYCMEFAIELHRDIQISENTILGFSLEDENIITRLSAYNDITSITIYYDDNTSEIIYSDWDSEDDVNNKNQSSYINNFGDLYIKVSKNKTIFDFFDIEKINDKEYMDYKWKMYDIGEE